MKADTFKKLAESFTAVGVSVNELGQAFKRMFGSDLETIRTLEHRRRCVLIACAMNKAQDPWVKSLLYRKFKNETLKF